MSNNLQSKNTNIQSTSDYSFQLPDLKLAKITGYISIFIPGVIIIYSILRLGWWLKAFENVQYLYGARKTNKSRALITCNSVIPIWSNAALGVSFYQLGEASSKFLPPKFSKWLWFYRIFTFLDIFAQAFKVLFYLLVSLSVPIWVKRGFVDSYATPPIILLVIMAVIIFGISSFALFIELTFYKVIAEAQDQNKVEYDKYLASKNNL